MIHFLFFAVVGFLTVGFAGCVTVPGLKYYFTYCVNGVDCDTELFTLGGAPAPQAIMAAPSYGAPAPQPIFAAPPAPAPQPIMAAPAPAYGAPTPAPLQIAPLTAPPAARGQCPGMIFDSFSQFVLT